MARWSAKAAHMGDRPSEANQIGLFIRNLQPTYSSTCCSCFWKFHRI